MPVRIEGAEQLDNLFDAAQLAASIQRVLGRVGQHVKVKMAVYPPQGEWKTPKQFPGRWYQRGFGPRWARKDGSIGGANTSENLQHQWKVQLAPRTVTIENEVSYAAYVQDADEQADFHKAHGWQTDQDVIDELERNRYVEHTIGREIQGLFE